MTIMQLDKQHEEQVEKLEQEMDKIKYEFDASEQQMHQGKPLASNQVHFWVFLIGKLWFGYIL
jgi:hypothetical protein